MIIRDWRVGIIFSGAWLVTRMRSLSGTSSNIFRRALCALWVSASILRKSATDMSHPGVW